MEETIRFAIHSRVLPMIETFPLEEAATAFEGI